MGSSETGNGEESGSEPNSSDAFRVITSGASLYVLGRVVNQVLRFVTNILLTNAVGAAMYGVYTYGHLLYSVFLVFTKLGTGKSLLKLLPRYQANSAQQNRVFGIAATTILAASVLTSVSLYVLAPYITEYTLQDGQLVTVLRIFAVLLPFYSFTKLSANIFKSIKNPRGQVLIEFIADPVIRLTSIGVAVVLGLSLAGIVSAVVVGGVGLAAIAVYLVATSTSLRPQFDITREDASEFYQISFPLMFNQAGAFLYNSVDVLLVGLFFSGVSVGIYNISMILATALTLPLAGFNQLFPPIASRLYSNGNLTELKSLYRRITRWVITLSLLPSLVFFIYPEEVLSIFGSEFTSGTPILILFTIAQLINLAVGPSGYILIMTDHERIAMMNQVILGVLNLFVSYFFLKAFGLIGAALASAGVLAIINLLRVIEVWHLERLFPYSSLLYKPLTAAFITAGLMLLSKSIVNGLLSVIIGGLVGTIVFFTVLILLGVEEEDLELLDVAMDNL